MSEKKGSGIFWFVLLLIGGGALFGISKAFGATKKGDKPNGGTPSGGGTGTPSGGGTGTPEGGSGETPSPATKDYTTTIQQSSFITPELLILSLIHI